jgi:molecular chaperone HtpG
MAEPTISFRLLETLTSALYEDPIILFREYVQNSLDAYNNETNNDKAKIMADFEVNINIDRDRFNIEIKDNGYGIKEEEFLYKMRLIGESDKKKLEDQIGFRGIGRLSAMPLCRQLVFENKPPGIKRRLIFSWDGKKFNDMLNRGADIDATLDQITSSSSEDYDGNVDDHYFKVKIHGYQEAIKDVLKSDTFQDRLCTLLPLKYSPKFTKQNQIKKKYHDFMGHNLDKFSCSVKLDGQELCKPYTDNDIRASGIVFWDLLYPSMEKNASSEKIGILWFTFDRVIKARPKDSPHGILVRSKNMLMGDQYALANDVTRSKSDYIATPRELMQALNGVCGEMLINSDKLRDNARRDWFKIDEESIKLRHIIVEFMRRLHNYRYAASEYFSDKKKEKRQEKLIEAYKGLITNYDPDKFIPDINKLKKEIEASKEVFEFADDDIPTSPITVKRIYDRIMKCLYEYFSAKNKKKVFIAVRTTVKKYLTQEPKG